MPAASFTCPYCNALFGDAGASSRGMTCPRCGEPLPADMQAQVTGSGVTVTTLIGAKSGGKLSNRAVGLIVLGVMFGAAMVGLGFALRTQEFRRANDFKVVKAVPQTIAPAAEWNGLGYLPEGSNLVAGIEVARLEQDAKAGKLPVKSMPALVVQALTLLEKWTGFRAEDINHAVLGVNVDGKLPQATVVVSTHRPFDPADIARFLKADRSQELHGQPVYAFRLQPLGEGRLWCPEKQTLILVLRADAFRKTDLDELPKSPRSGTKGLAEPIRNLMSERGLGKQSSAWLAGHGDWQDLLPFFPVDRLKVLPVSKKDLAVLARVRTFGLELDTTDSPRVMAHLFAGDEANTLAVKKLLEELPVEAIRVVAELSGPAAFWISSQVTLQPKEAKKPAN